MLLKPEVDAVRADLNQGKGEIRELASEVASISEELKGLVQAEIQLAKAETKEQVGFVVKVTMWGAIALMASFITLVWVALTATYALAEGMDAWLAALIVTVALGLVVVMAALMAKSKLKEISLVPRRTTRSVKEDIAWAKHQLSSKPKSTESVMR